jgi:hypothetical protein
MNEAARAMTRAGGLFRFILEPEAIIGVKALRFQVSSESGLTAFVRM